MRKQWPESSPGQREIIQQSWSFDGTVHAKWLQFDMNNKHYRHHALARLLINHHLGQYAIII
jgi:hypothetical protein